MAKASNDDTTNDLPTVGGNPNPNAGGSLSWLDEVKADAEFNYRKRQRDEEEREAYEASKASGKPDPGVVGQ